MAMNYNFLTLNHKTGYCEITRVLTENEIEEINLKIEKS